LYPRRNGSQSITRARVQHYRGSHSSGLPMSVLGLWLRGVGGGLGPRVALMQLDGCRTGRSAAADSDVQEFDEDRETHREVDVALGDVLVEAFE
jgi:hypothetical protein